LWWRVHRERRLSMDLKYWQEQSHGLARSKGWYAEYDKRLAAGDEDWCNAFRFSRLQLIANEIAEASEELRDARPYMYFKEVGGHVVYSGPPPAAQKPEGFVIELADVFLRVVDFAESERIKLEWRPDVYVHAEHLRSSVELNCVLFGLTGLVAAHATESKYRPLDALVSAVRSLCEQAHTAHTFEEVVRIKHTYNLTRPNMHGKGF
jgi:uncharacterized membrane protein